MRITFFRLFMGRLPELVGFQCWGFVSGERPRSSRTEPLHFGMFQVPDVDPALERASTCIDLLHAAPRTLTQLFRPLYWQHNAFDDASETLPRNIFDYSLVAGSLQACCIAAKPRITVVVGIGFIHRV